MSSTLDTVTALPDAAERLADDVDRGEFCTGVQAYVSHRDEVVLDVAFGRDGLGRPMTQRSLSAVYCAIKPLLTVLVLLAEQDGALGLDSTLGDVLDLGDNPALAAVRIDDLLAHRAGLHTLRSYDVAPLPPARRHVLAMAARPPDGWDPRADAGYSEWLGFYLIGLVLERATGAQLAELLRTRLLEPLGIEAEVSLGLCDDDLARVAVNVDLREQRRLPLLMERAEWFAGHPDPCLGGFATMQGLGQFYEWVLATLDGRRSDPLAPERLRRACRPNREVVLDATLGFETDWGLGFMTGLGRLGFGPYASARAVGHTGQVGTSIAFTDPEHDLAGAVLYNGVIDQAVGISVRRPAIVSKIYRDLGIAKDPPAES